MKTKLKLCVCLALIFTCMLTACSNHKDITDISNVSIISSETKFTDTTGIFSMEEVSDINNRFDAIENSDGISIIVLVLNNDSIENYDTYATDYLSVNEFGDDYILYILNYRELESSEFIQVGGRGENIFSEKDIENISNALADPKYSTDRSGKINAFINFVENTINE